MHTHSIQQTNRRLAKGLGWFSVGVGVAELVAPRAVAKLIGVSGDTATHLTLRALGTHKIASGVAILSRPGRARPVWSRLIGDAIDIALLGVALRTCTRARSRVIGTLAGIAALTAVDVLLVRKFARATEMVTRTITISRSPDEVRRAWASLGEEAAAATATFRPAPGGRGTEMSLRFMRNSRITNNDL